MFAIDELAYASPMIHWPPLGKFALVLALLVGSLVSSFLVIPFGVFILGMALLIISTRLRFPKVIALALLEGVAIILFGAVIIAFLTQVGEPLLQYRVFGVDLVLTEGGIHQGLMVFLRALAGVSVMLFFATSTPIPHLAAALRQLRVPAYITELVILVYRYSFLLFEQLQVLYTAAQCRLGFRGTRNKFQRSQVALSCRNFQGEFPAFRPPARITAYWVIVPIVALATILLANQLMKSQAIPGW
ncbi:MAG: hypothetical protein MUE65_03310 [Methanomassiliicoccales archaeon]|nr:hypothetical protein [Methanomassiliicoccales archaeon]